MRRLDAAIIAVLALLVIGIGADDLSRDHTTTVTRETLAPTPPTATCNPPIGEGEMGSCQPQRLGPPTASQPFGSAFGYPQGVDISNNNGTVSFGYLKRNGIAFVVAKATEACHIDSTVSANIQKAREANMPLGLYDYFRPGFNPRSIATCFASVIKRAIAAGVKLLPPTFDVEDFSEGPVCTDLGIAADTVRRLVPHIELTRYGSSFNSPNCGRQGFLGWPADWGVSSPVSIPGIPGYLMWQWFGPRFASTSLSGMDRDKGAASIFKHEYLHPKPKPVPQKLLWKRKLYADYRFRRVISGLLGKHHCYTKPTPASYKARACPIFRRQHRNVAHSITLLHEKGVY